jgi:hypothetical protein
MIEKVIAVCLCLGPFKSATSQVSSFDLVPLSSSLVLTIDSFGHGWWTSMRPRSHFTPFDPFEVSGMSESGN